jgi:ubiquitin carboxyl-terminal hydrolase 7
LLSVAEGNGWRPDKDADKVDAHKGSTLIAEGLPPILQFHLKRFMYEWQTDSMTKVNSRLAFPSELDLSSICRSVDSKEEGEDCVDLTTYDLQSVVIHMGKYGVGHYYSYVRPDMNSDTWYRFNDHVVEKVSEKDAYGGEDGYSAHQQSKTKIPFQSIPPKKNGKALDEMQRPNSQTVAPS